MNPYTVYISGFSYYFLEERNGFVSRQIVYFGYSQDVLNDDGTSIKHISNISSDSDTSLDFTTNNLKVTDTATVNNLVVGKEKFSDIISNLNSQSDDNYKTLKENISKLENRLSTVSFIRNNDGNKTAVFTGTRGHSYRILISHVYNPNYYETLVNLWTTYNSTGGLILIHNYDGIYVSLSGETITVTLSSEHTGEMINAVRFIDEGTWQ